MFNFGYDEVVAPVVVEVEPVVAPVVAPVVVFAPYTCPVCRGSGRLTLRDQKCYRCTSGMITVEDARRYKAYLTRKASGKTMNRNINDYI
jgi:hypothetical protein